VGNKDDRDFLPWVGSTMHFVDQQVPTEDDLDPIPIGGPKLRKDFSRTHPNTLTEPREPLNCPLTARTNHAIEESQIAGTGP
jgi:hypothetical protein